jgi:hypothetical protein
MSAPLAGKFSDHYETLGVDSKSSNDSIRAAYTKLLAVHASDREKINELNGAFDILMDPELRKSFDQVRGGGNEDTNFTFPVQEFLADLDSDSGRRICLLAMLYYRRKYYAISPGISIRHVETLMNVTSEQLAFISWVLKQRGLITADDKSRMLITVTGIEYIEKLKPSATDIEPWLRPSALGEAAAVEVKAELNGGVKAEPPAAAQAAPPAAARQSALAASPAAAPTSLPPPPAPPRPALSITPAGLSSLRTALQKTMSLPTGKPK